jgi:VanZ family protein
MTAASSVRSSWRPTWHVGALAVYIALVVYATLYPFTPRWPQVDFLTAALRIPKYYTQFDLVLNALAYVPLGWLAYLQARPISASRWTAWLRAVGGATLLSLSLEALQLGIVGRVSSIGDVASNAFGALLGAAFVANAWGEAAVARVHVARLRHIMAGNSGELGIALVLLWLFAQLNPTIPFFEAGNIVAATVASDRPLANAAAASAWQTLEAAGVAASVIGFGLFVSVLMRRREGRLRIVFLLVLAAALAKAVTATAMLKPALALDWVDGINAAGVIMGLLIFAPLRRLPERVRAYLGGLALLAGAMMTKAASIYDTLGDLLGLFRWPHGQLNSFASLTRYLYEVWPLLALLFMVWLFVVPRSRE